MFHVFHASLPSSQLHTAHLYIVVVVCVDTSNLGTLGGGQMPTLKTCKCDNGVPESGASCPKSGDLKCKSCQGGYELNGGKTKCSGTLIYATSIFCGDVLQRTMR